MRIDVVGLGSLHYFSLLPHLNQPLAPQSSGRWGPHPHCCSRYRPCLIRSRSLGILKCEEKTLCSIDRLWRDSECTHRPTGSQPPITTYNVTAGSNCIWLISNEAHMHYDTTVGCYLEALVNGGGMQQLDSVQGHSDCVMSCHQGLNLKVGKKNYMIKIISYVVIAFCNRKANILHRWSNILHIFYGNKGLCHGCRSY